MKPVLHYPIDTIAEYLKILSRTILCLDIAVVGKFNTIMKLSQQSQLRSHCNWLPIIIIIQKLSGPSPVLKTFM